MTHTKVASSYCFEWCTRNEPLQRSLDTEVKRDHPYEADQSAVVWSAPEFESSVHANPNDQGGKHSRVRFNLKHHAFQ